MRLSTALAMISVVAGAGAAAAQSTPSTTAAPADDTATVTTRNAKSGDTTVVIITGARVSQRSSIDRKKHAKTATDSITAEDVGSFPDKNIGEAISRIAGVQLGRNDFGEGQDVQIRGATAEQTHVEIDGMSQLSTKGGLGDSSNAARGADFRELPSDLVKSVDVVKGSTPALTEGSLGGTVIIAQRTGLDFKKPYFSFRYDETYNTLGQKWTPEWNLIASHKFFGKRLGVLLNVTSSEIQNNTDRMQPQRNGTAGSSRFVDLDQSPNKTFDYSKAPVDSTATAGNFQVFNANGQPVYSSLSPIQILQQSTAAKTPADCLAAFPALTTAQRNAIPAGSNQLGSVATANASASTNQSTAQGEQTNGLQTCLNQWNDYLPSLYRTLPSQQDERRLAIDLRFDYRVNEDLTVYLKTDIANRKQDNKDWGFNVLNQAAGDVYTRNVSGTFTQPTVAANSNGLVTPITVTNPAYSFFSNGLCPTTKNAQGQTVGCGVDTDITAFTIDASHHVTSLTINDGAVQVNGSESHTLQYSWYAQAGGSYRHGPVKLDFMAGTSGAHFQRGTIGLGLTYWTGPITSHVTPSGLWSSDLASNLDFYNPNNYIRTNPAVAQAAVAANTTRAGAPAYTAQQAALYGTPTNLTWRPTQSTDAETQLKYDLTYDFQDRLPFFQDIQTGLQSRNHTGNGWGGGGVSSTAGSGVVGAAGYVAPNSVPTLNWTTQIRVCEPQSTSTQSCQYGYVPNSSLAGTTAVPDSNALNGVLTMNTADYAKVIGNSLYQRPTDFLAGYPDKGNVTARFPYLSVSKFLGGLPASTNDLGLNYDCIKVCKGADGKMYEQPHSAFNERTTALYYMVDFEQKLPFGMVFNGNFGTRYVKTQVQATGRQTFSHLSVISTTTTTNPNTGVVTVIPTFQTTTISLNTSINSNTQDFTPSYNLNLWVVPDKVVLRYYTGHVIARPSVNQMLPSGTCTINDFTLGTEDSAGNEVDQNCSGRVGNPGLKPYKAINHNETLEWYPNKDDQFSIAYYYNNVYIGAPINSTATNSTLFAGTSFIDPVTGVPLANTSFTYPTYTNGPAGIQRGVEFSTKLAFSFLPWFLKYTGTDFNYSKLDSKNSVAQVDLISGQPLPPQNQAAYFENWSIWYDDGKLNARIAYQDRGQSFLNIAPQSNFFNNFPTSFDQGGSTIRTPYNPGAANFQSRSRFLDVKATYKLSKTLEIFVDGRNVLHGYSSQTYQPSMPFSDGTPTLDNFTYGGSRYTVGFTFRH